MKKTLLVLLAIVVAIGALAGAGFAGYHIGFRQASSFAQTEDGKYFHHFMPFGHGSEFPGRGFHNDDRGFHRFDGSDFGKHHRGRGFGFISPIFILAKLAFLGLLVWLGYNLFKGNGWQLTLARMPASAPSETPAEQKSPKKASKGKQ